MLTGRPGFLFVPDRDSYREERGFYYPPEEAPFPVAETKEALLEQIKCFDIE
ncbi:MAG: CDP-glycerol glycerophosphotransferase family protein, partial [Lachnospiraceae bacterium]|nr:CDP-glycerol glycerophosphotransferase family protein [Lachnospiraceae bacterium]